MIYIDKHGVTIFGHEVPDQIVCLLHLRHEFLAAWAGLDGNIYDIHLFKAAADQVIESHETIEYHGGCNRIGNCQVIIAAIDYDLFRMVGKNDLVCIPDQVREARSPKTAVDNGIPRKITLDI